MSAAVNLDELRDRADQLESRLNDGLARIKEAEGFGRDVKAWEDFWIDLLRQYEAICDELLAEA